MHLRAAEAKACDAVEGGRGDHEPALARVPVNVNVDVDVGVNVDVSVNVSVNVTTIRPLRGYALIAKVKAVPTRPPT